ncbi:hypothetical protein ACFWIJ_40090 [Streptomyces sp. NPDC127079]|uniref:hypothetical protein n=1 Tax=Streptomyces sp. NPDC127079 TaxID=3347132 RepID=UPI00364635D6
MPSDIPAGGPSPGPRPNGPARLAAVDGLRLVAALMVAAYHFLGTPTPHFWGQTELRDLAVTYPFYLVHQSIGIPLAKGLNRAFPTLGPLPSTAVSVGCVLGLSLLVHTAVERPLGRLLRHRLTLDARVRDLGAKPVLTRAR